MQLLQQELERREGECEEYQQQLEQLTSVSRAQLTDFEALQGQYLAQKSENEIHLQDLHILQENILTLDAQLVLSQKHNSKLKAKIEKYLHELCQLEIENQELQEAKLHDQDRLQQIAIEMIDK